MAKTVLAWDTDRHGEGCECGVCDSTGAAYGAAIISYMDFKVKDMSEDEFMEYLQEQEPVEVVYASSMDSAIEQAKDIAGIARRSA